MIVIFNAFEKSTNATTSAPSQLSTPTTHQSDSNSLLAKKRFKLDTAVDKISRKCK
jgi:hypothetical protein